MERQPITKEDAMSYLQLVNSIHSPSFVPGRNIRKIYYPLLANRESADYKTFIRVYQYFREELQDREKTILDTVYRVDGKAHTLKSIGNKLGIDGSYVGSIRSKAERKIANQIVEFVYGPRKQSFDSVISNQPDDLLLQIVRVTRPWEKILDNYYTENQPRYNHRRKKLLQMVNRVWYLDMLDHREQALKILNINKEDVY